MNGDFPIYRQKNSRASPAAIAVMLYKEPLAEVVVLKIYFRPFVLGSLLSEVEKYSSPPQWEYRPCPIWRMSSCWAPPGPRGRPFSVSSVLLSPAISPLEILYRGRSLPGNF